MVAVLLLLPAVGLGAALRPGRIGTDVTVGFMILAGCVAAVSATPASVRSSSLTRARFLDSLTALLVSVSRARGLPGSANSTERLTLPG